MTPGTYECGCTVSQQPRGRRLRQCRWHRKPYVPLKPSTYKPSPVSSKDIVAALRRKYADVGRSNEWAFFEELRVGTGYKWARRGKGKAHNPEQRLDAFVMNLWPSKQFLRIAFEIKVSKQDFRNEIAAPEKRATAIKLSNQFYFVTPKGLVNDFDIPADCGLMEVDEAGRVTVKVKAPLHSGLDAAPWLFVAAVARRVNRV